MIPASALARTDTNGFLFYEDPVGLSIERPGTRRYSINNSPSKALQEIVNEKKKVLVSLGVGPYHFWHESIGAMLVAIREYGAELVVLDNSVNLGKNEHYYPYLLNLLDKNKISYIEIFPSISEYIINNLIIYDLDVFIAHGWSDLVYDFTKVVDNNAPTRKAYLSRNGRGLEFSNLSNGLSFNHDIRILDENVLEDYLSSRGYDVVVPEEIGTYKDQIEYFNSVKVICSVSGSGLANSIFMPPGGKVIEIATSLILPLNNDVGQAMNDGVESLQYYYDLISFEKRHVHVRLPNHSRLSSGIIDKIEGLNINV